MTPQTIHQRRYQIYRVHRMRRWKANAAYTAEHKYWRENPTPEIDPKHEPQNAHGGDFVEDTAVEIVTDHAGPREMQQFDNIYYVRKLKKRITSSFLRYLSWELWG